MAASAQAAWLRARVPLSCHQNEVVAVAALPDWEVDMLVADGWQAGPAETGYWLEVRFGDRIWGTFNAEKSS